MSEYKTLGFGKHANRALHNVPLKYLRWVYFNTKSERIKSVVREQLCNSDIDPELRRIPANILPSMVGEPIHLSWSGAGNQWILKAIEGNKLTLMTPVTKKQIFGWAHEALYCNKHLGKEKTHD